MRRLRFLLTAVLVALLFSASCIPWPYYDDLVVTPHASGDIVDAAGAPLAGLLVYYYGFEDNHVFTDINGSFALDTVQEYKTWIIIAMDEPFTRVLCFENAASGEVRFVEIMVEEGLHELGTIAWDELEVWE